MRSRIGSIAALYLLLGLMPSGPLAAQTLAGYLNLSSRQLQPGDVLEVDVVVNLTDQAQRLGAYEAGLTWNPEVLELAEIVEKFAPLQFAKPQTRAQEGELLFSAFDVEGAGGVVRLLRARFDVVGSPGQSTSLDLSFSILVAAQTFVDLRDSLQVLPASVRIAGGFPDRRIAAWLQNSLPGDRGRSLETEVLLDLSGIPEHLGAYEAQLTWNPQALKVVDILDGHTPEFTGPQTRLDTGRLLFSHFHVVGAGGRLSLARLRFEVEVGMSLADGDLRLSFGALAAAGSFEDLLPALETREAVVSAIRDHSWGGVKRLWRH
jgi:hypothetical protein